MNWWAVGFFVFGIICLGLIVRLLIEDQVNHDLTLRNEYLEKEIAKYRRKK